MDAIAGWVIGIASSHSLGGVLVSAAIKGLMLLSLASAVTLLLRGAAAATRHLVWTLAVVGLLALPVLSVVAPEWPVAIPALEPGDAVVPGPSRHRGPAPAAPMPMPAEAPMPAPVEPIAPAPPAGLRSSGPRAPQPTPAAIGSGLRQHSHRPPAPVPRGAGESAVAPNTPLGATERREGRWPAAAFWIWFGGAAFGLGTLMWGVARTWYLSATARPVTHGRWLTMAKEVASHLGIDRPVLLVWGARRAMPMTWGVVRATVLVPTDSDSWPTGRMRAVLLHELAHVKRHDCLTQLLAQAALSLHWFNPLAWVAVHRLRVERERACDDEVLNAGAKPSEYAGHLLDVARSLRAPLRVGPATVPMARRNQLSGRVLAVLDRSQRRTAPGFGAPSGFVAAVVILPLAALTPVRSRTELVTPTIAPARVFLAPLRTPAAGSIVAEVAAGHGVSSSVVRPSQDPCAAPSGRGATRTHVDDDEWQVRWRRGACSGDLKVIGDVEFTDEYTDVIRVSPGGRFELEVDDEVTERRIEIRADAAGTLERRWSVNRRESAFGDAARTAFARMLTTLFRETSYQAHERSRAILDRLGADALEREVRLVRGGHTKRIYLGTLLESGEVDRRRLPELVRWAGGEISSDYELAELLLQVAGRYLTDDGLRGAFVDAAATIGSDYEHRRVLAAALQQSDLTLEVLDAILASSLAIESDYELTELLIQVAKSYPAERALPPSYLEAAATIGSDFEQRRALAALLDRRAVTDDALEVILQGAGDIASDYELAELLVQVAGRYRDDRPLPPDFLAAARTIHSDFELRRVLDTILERDRLSPVFLNTLLEASLQIASDFEAAELLGRIAERNPLDPEVRPAFFGNVDEIGSSYERSRVLKIVARGQTLDDDLVRHVLTALRDVGSDHERANLLTLLAHEYRIQGELRDLYLELTDDLGSRHERNRVLAALTQPRGQ